MTVETPSKRSTTIERAQDYAKKSLECEKYKRLYEHSQLKLSIIEENYTQNQHVSAKNLKFHDIPEAQNTLPTPKASNADTLELKTIQKNFTLPEKTRPEEVKIHHKTEPSDDPINIL